MYNDIIAILGFLLLLVCVCSWITHILVCIANEQYILLIGGAIMAPIWMIHWIGVWFWFF